MVRYTQTSFTGGELSPSLYARNELAKYSIGLKTLKNGFVKTEGSVSNRAGLEFVCEVKDSSKITKIIGFSFNTEQTYIIQLGDKYARFIKNGAEILNESNLSPVEIETPYLSDELFNIKYAQNADVLTLCHKNHSPCELSRLSHYNWTLKEINFKPQISPPVNLSAIWTGGSEQKTTYNYVVTAVKKDTYEESNRSEIVSVEGEREANWGTSDYVTIKFSEVENAAEYNIYKSINGVFAYIGTTSETTFIDNKIEGDLTSTAPIFCNPFENNYPSCVNYFQQRKVYACLKNNPQNIILSQSTSNNNFNISRPLSPSDSINITLSEREVNEIRYIIALNDLILLTSGGEWKLNGTDGAISASSSLMASPQSFYGCANVLPVVSGNMILFVQSGGSVVRDLGYSYMADGYDGSELSIYANHLFEGKQVVDMAYSKEPYRILWLVMSDGTLNALTYNKSEEVCAWHRHETKGFFESVAVVREGFEDVPYFVVRRNINGTIKRYIERMASRYLNKTQDGIFLDSCLTYEGKAVSVISGLEHLEGETINILADGCVVEGKVVKDGKIELPYPASKIVAGLPYEFELETLNLEGDTTHGLVKIINSISFKVDKSREDFFVIGTQGDVVQNLRSINSVNNNNYLHSGTVNSYSFSNYTDEARVHIKQIYPLPITINSISMDITLEDTNA